MLLTFQRQWKFNELLEFHTKPAHFNIWKIQLLFFLIYFQFRRIVYELWRSHTLPKFDFHMKPKKCKNKTTNWIIKKTINKRSGRRKKGKEFKCGEKFKQEITTNRSLFPTERHHKNNIIMFSFKWTFILVWVSPRLREFFAISQLKWLDGKFQQNIQKFNSFDFFLFDLKNHKNQYNHIILNLTEN